MDDADGGCGAEEQRAERLGLGLLHEHRAREDERGGDDAGEQPAAEAIHRGRAVGARRLHRQAAEARATTIRLKSDLKRMEEKLHEVEAKKGILVAQVEQARAGGGAESLGARGGTSAFDEFRRMEAQIDRAAAEGEAATEVERALSPGGERTEDVEAKFARLEGKDGKGGSAIDDELAALKQKVRIK